MLFNSLDFWLFFPLVLAVYSALPQRHVRARQIALLAASYAFYAFWDLRFCGLIALSTLVDFVVSRQLERTSRRKAWVAVSVVTNLGILGTFKYLGFFVEEVGAVLASLGIQMSPIALNIALPVGISFYTFQTLGYTLDVYRKRILPERHFIPFALFVSFFPQLMAGPIERARDLLPQLHVLRRPTPQEAASGFRLFLLGMVKKVAVSSVLWDHAQVLYLNPELRGTAEAWWLGLLMLTHIYMDFSGYSDMAVGLGRMLGVKLSPNFKRVFAARNFPDLWRRWHMTLGRWFRDYLWIPLRKRGWNKAAATLLTFALIGVWHGANWTFLWWGVLMGLVWWVDDQTNWQQRLTAPLPFGGALASALTIGLFVFISQLFPVDRLADAWTLMRAMAGFPAADALPWSGVPRAVAAAMLLAAGIEWGVPYSEARIQASARWARNWGWVRAVVFIPWGCALCVEGLWQAREFVYFQF